MVSYLKNGLTSFLSNSLIDEEWDQFLQNTPLGEITQTCAWARYKRIEGWQCLRALLKMNQRIVGGFQVLWKSTRFGRVGYITKGPVAATEKEDIVDALIEQLIMISHHLSIAAMIFQPPGNSRIIAERLPNGLFVRNHLLAVINTTLVVDVSEGIQAVEKRMNKTWRKHIRQAIRRGILIREGTEKHISEFFQLMLRTCERQGVSPNPPSESALRALWRELGGEARCRLTFAEHAGRIVAGLFYFHFKDIVKIWKKGAYAQDLNSHPMELLYYDAFSWAHNNGFRLCDFISLDRNIAETMLRGMLLSENQKASRDFFHLGLGGQPVLMPDSYIYIPNGLIRWGYRALIKNPRAFDYLKRYARRI